MGRVWVYFVCFLLALSTFRMLPAADSEEEREYERFRFRYFSEQAKRTGSPPSTDYGDHGHSSLSESELKERQEAVKKMWQKRRQRGGSITKADVVELYATAKDFKVIHSLLGNEITIQESKAIGRLRQEIHNEVLESLYRSKRFGSRMGVNDFGSGADMSKVDAKTDIDFTLYGDDQSVTGRTMVAAYIEAFRKITAQYKQAIDPGQCDIVGHQYEATIPDWRQASALSDFEIRLRTGRGLLKANPEAYFIEGAYLQQVMGRSVDPGAKTFLWYGEDANGELIKTQVNAAKVPKFFYHPQFAARYAWGGAVGNWHFFNAHGDDKPAQGKYLLRSIDNGPGLLLKNKTAEFEKMDSSGRQQLVRRIYGNRFDGEKLQRLTAVMETAVRMRQLKSAKTLDMGTERGRIQAYEPLIHQIRKEHAGVEATDTELLKMAEIAFVEDGNKLLIQNNIDTADNRLADWLAPSLKVGSRLDWVDEDGLEKKIVVDDGMVKRLQYSAFFELRDGFELMPKKMVERIKRANPRFVRDINILEGIIEKQKIMMNAPESMKPAEAQGWREKAAQEVRQDMDILKQHFQSKGYASGAWLAGKTLWARGNQLETWAKKATIRRVAYTAGGKNYALQLDRLYQSVDASNERFLGPMWMARMDKGTSVIMVLKAWVEEGEINDQVLSVAVYEGMSYIPGVSLLYAVNGGLKGVATLTFATLIPGYGQILLACNFTKGAVELAGLAVFEPLKRDKVLLAYQGYLEPESGGLLHAGQKERVESPRPALIMPIDSNASLSLEERREHIYDYFHEPIVRDMKKLPSVWYDEYEMPKEWREKEFEILRIRVRQFINDWWTGTGVFDGYDVLTVHRGSDIRLELEEQLINDYVKGKNQAIQRMMQEHERGEEKIRELYSAIAGQDLAMNEEAQRQRGQYQQNGEVIEAFCLEEMPTIEPSLEIIAAPYIQTEKVLGKEGKEENLIEHINLRAQVHASKKDHPTPWRITWELSSSGGKKQEFSEERREEIEATRGSVTAKAVAYDAKEKVIAFSSFTFQVEKVDMDERKKEESEEEEGIDFSDAEAILDRMKEEAALAQAQSQSTKEKCQEAQEKSEQLEKELEELNTWLNNAQENLESLVNAYTPLKNALVDLQKEKKAFDALAKEIAELRDEAGEATLEVCENAQAVVDAPSIEKRNQAYERAKQAKQEGEKAWKRAEELIKRAEAFEAHVFDARKKLDQFTQELEKAKQNAFQAQGPTSTSQQHLIQAQAKEGSAQETLQQAQATEERTAELLSQGLEIVEAQISGVARDLEVQMKEFMGVVKSNVQSAENCPEEALEKISTVERELNSFQTDTQQVDKKRLELEESLIEEDLEGALQVIERDLDATLFLIELFFEDIEARMKDAKLCMDLAEKNKDAPLMVTVPDLYGKSGLEVQSLLKPLNLRWSVTGGDPAPQEELEHTVEAQAPPAYTRVEVDSTVELTFYGDFHQMLTVPDVFRLPLDRAKDQLVSAGFSVKEVEGTSTPSRALVQTVYAQIPEPKSIVCEGTVVTIVYHKKEELMEVPNIQGITEDAAKDILSNAGFVIAVSEGEEAPSKEESKKTYSQNPAPASYAPKGSVVKVKVHKDYLERYELPNFIGMKIKDVRTILQGQGVSVSVQTDREPPERGWEGDIFSQTPRAGTEIIVGEDTVQLQAYKEEEKAYFVVARLYFPKPPEPPKKADGSDEDVKISQLLRKLDPATMPLRPSDDPVLLHVDQEGLMAYPIEFFRLNEYIAVPVSWIIDIAATKEVSARSSTFNGSFLMKVEGVAENLEELKGLGVDTNLVGSQGQVFKSIQLFTGEGTFQGYEAHDGASSQLSGGPFEAGWALQHRRQLLDLSIDLFEFLGCFIATAVYDHSYSRELWELRDFRDRMLKTSLLGRKLVSKYYQVAPKYGARIRKSPLVRELVRPALDLIVYFSRNVDKEDPVAQWTLEQALIVVDFFWSDEELCQEPPY